MMSRVCQPSGSSGRKCLFLLCLLMTCSIPSYAMTRMGIVWDGREKMLKGITLEFTPELMDLVLTAYGEVAGHTNYGSSRKVPDGTIVNGYRIAKNERCYGQNCGGLALAKLWGRKARIPTKQAGDIIRKFGERTEPGKAREWDVVLWSARDGDNHVGLVKAPDATDPWVYSKDGVEEAFTMPYTSYLSAKPTMGVARFYSMPWKDLSFHFEKFKPKGTCTFSGPENVKAALLEAAEQIGSKLDLDDYKLTSDGTLARLSWVGMTNSAGKVYEYTITYQMSKDKLLPIKEWLLTAASNQAHFFRSNGVEPPAFSSESNALFVKPAYLPNTKKTILTSCFFGAGTQPVWFEIRAGDSKALLGFTQSHGIPERIMEVESRHASEIYQILRSCFEKHGLGRPLDTISVAARQFGGLYEIDDGTSKARYYLKQDGNRLWWEAGPDVHSGTINGDKWSINCKIGPYQTWRGDLTWTGTCFKGTIHFTLVPPRGKTEQWDRVFTITPIK